jgi:chaperone modulatory protein CbpM
MQTEELIPAIEFCSSYQVELSFIQHLHDSGLIEARSRNGALFLTAAELPDLEKFVRWHYELSINQEGIEAIFHLLSRVHDLQQENLYLRNRLAHFENRRRAEDFTDGQLI